MSKQDRQGVRTPADIERKYNLGKMKDHIAETNEKLTNIESLLLSMGGGSAKEEQAKTINITENGTWKVLPDEGKVLSSVTVNVDVAGGGGGTRSEITCSTAGEVMFAGYFDSTDRTATKANDGLAIVGYCTRFNNSKYSYFACYVGESSESVQATNIKSTTPSTIEYGGKTYYYTCTSTINRELDTKNAWLIGTYEDGYVNTSGFICNAAAVRRLLDYYFCKINE